MKKKAILTFDLEFWHNSEFLKSYLPDNKYDLPDFTIETTLPLLDLLKKKGLKATFFVLGELAQKYPDLIKRISDNGHEIASHGHSHAVLGELDKNSFEREIVSTSEILERITGKRPLFFRAPAFSLDNKMTWTFDILKKYNLKYITRRPTFSGGNYFRFLPLNLFLLYLQIASGKETPILYFHPHELFDFVPRVETAPFYKKLIKYWGIKKAWEKLEKLIERFECISVGDYLGSKL